MLPMASPTPTHAGALDAESSLSATSADILALLRRTKEWKFYRQHFQARTGMRLDLAPLPLSDGESRTQEGNTGRGNAFCRLMNPGRNPMCAHCPLSVLKSKKCKGATSSVSGHCGGGLLEVTAPIRFLNRPVVRLWTGQVTMSPLTVESFLLRAPGVWSVCPLDGLQEAAESWHETRVVSPETFASYCLLMSVIAEQLSILTDRILGVGALDGTPSEDHRARITGQVPSGTARQIRRLAIGHRHPGEVGCRRVHPAFQK